MPPATMDAFRDHGRPRASLEEDVDGRQGGDGGAARRRRLDRRRHREARRGRGAPVRRRRRPALRRGAEKAPDGARRQAQHDELQAARPIDRRGQGGARGLAQGRQGSPAVGAATPRCGPRPTRPNGSAGSASSTSSWPASPQLEGFAADVQEGRVHATCCCSAWAGRASAPRCSRETFRRAAGLSEAACARFDRSGADPALRKRDRPRRRRCSSCRANRAARSSPTSSSSISSNAPRRRSAPPRRRSVSSRSPIPARRSKRSRGNEGFRARLPRRAEHRRALFGAVEFRHGAGGGDRASTPRDVPRKTAEMVRSCAPSAPPVGEPRRDPRRDPGRAASATAATRSTIIASPGIADFGAWLEQLLAESTGKHRQGHRPGRRRAARAAGGLRQ